MARQTSGSGHTAFRAAIEAVPSVAEAYERGIRALTNSHRSLVTCDDPHRLTGSIDLDGTLRDEYPNDARWDYGIGWRAEGGRERAIWIEVHGAQTKKVGEVVKKLQWLKDWLAQEAQEPLRQLTEPNGDAPAFVWLASGTVNLPRNSRQRKAAAAAGILPRKHLNLP